VTATSSPSTNLDLDALRRAVSGDVVAPGDAEYDTARTVVTGGIDRHPAAIVRVVDAPDVAAAIRIARENDLEIAVRSGGHSGAGHSTTEGGLVIDLAKLNSIDLDTANRTVWAGAGLTARELSEAVAKEGLAIGFGDTGSVGIGGITLGGGVGYLVRKFGLTIDNLLAAEIVTADGEILQVDGSNHPDLFWALRGGGGNFGVVVRFRYQLSSVPQAVGGMLFLPATAETVAGWIAASEAAPEELSTIANVMPAPPMPFLKDDQVGKLAIFGILLYAGDPEEGQKAIAPFRALAEPIADFVHPISYPEIYPPDDPEYHPLAIARTMFVDRVDGPVAEAIVEHLGQSDASIRVAQLRVLGGAMARVPADATAFAHRSSKIMVNVAAFYEGEEDKPRREAWVEEFVRILQQDDHGAYVNFLVDEGEERIRAAYPGATWDRLREIKRRYDPNNVFRLNQNVPPAGAAGA
jgi:FAD/FMN-containing dehydrogenase